jgi:hypothetical protein
MSVPLVPSLGDYRAFDGAHCHVIWRSLSDSWRCPGCGRTKFEIMRWTKRTPPGRTESYMGWLAAFHEHHDHGSDRFGFAADGSFLPQGPERFPRAIICDHCNAADGSAKRKLGLPSNWTFSPGEIRQFVTARPHRGHVISFEAARAIYDKAQHTDTSTRRP